MAGLQLGVDLFAVDGDFEGAAVARNKSDAVGPFAKCLQQFLRRPRGACGVVSRPAVKQFDLQFLARYSAPPRSLSLVDQVAFVKARHLDGTDDNEAFLSGNRLRVSIDVLNLSSEAKQSIDDEVYLTARTQGFERACHEAVEHFATTVGRRIAENKVEASFRWQVVGPVAQHYVRVFDFVHLEISLGETRRTYVDIDKRDMTFCRELRGDDSDGAVTTTPVQNAGRW